MRSGLSRVASDWIPDHCRDCGVRDDEQAASGRTTAHYLRAGFFFLVVRFFLETAFFLTAFFLTAFRLRGVLVAAFTRFTSSAVGGRDDWSVIGSVMRLLSRSAIWSTVLGFLGSGMMRAPFASSRLRRLLSHEM